MSILFINYSIEMVFRAVPFSSLPSRRTCSGKSELWQQRTAFICLCSWVGHHVRSLQCWYVVAQNLKNHLCETEDRPNISPSPFLSAASKLCFFHQWSKTQILMAKFVKRLFFEPSSPSTCISIRNAGWVAGISHSVQQQKDCFPLCLSKPKTFSPGPYWVSFV